MQEKLAAIEPVLQKLDYECVEEVPKRTWSAVGWALIANLLLVCGAFFTTCLFFTAIFLLVSVYTLPLNLVLFFAMWRRFQFKRYLILIHAIVYGASAIFVLLITIFGRKYFEFLL